MLKIGAVAYDAKVVPIWELMREYFAEAGVPIDYVLFSNYEAQVDALFNFHIDVAWNTNVAYVRCQQRSGSRCQILGMRNTDLDFRTHIVARPDRGVRAVEDLRGKRLALGSADSAQAAIMPLFYLRRAGIEPDTDLALIRFDIDVGKHGDTGLSELEVINALHEGRADAGAIGLATWLRLVEQGQVNTSLVQPVWTSPPYDHCNFTALPDMDGALAEAWTRALLAMSYSDPRWRRLMDLEGLTSWVAGRREGYSDLEAAMGAPG